MKILITTFYLIKGAMNNKRALLLYILLPLCCILLPIFVFNTPGKNKDKISISIVDLNKSQYSSNLIRNLKEEYGFTIYLTDLQQGRENLIFDKTSCILIIPESFQQDLLSKTFPKVELVYLKEKEEISIIKNSLNTYISNLNLLAHIDKLDLNLSSKTNIHLVNKELSSNSSSVLLDSSIGLMLLFMIVLVNTTFSNFLRDKENNTLNRVLKTGLGPSNYLTSYILFCIIICIAQSFILIALLSLFKINLQVSYSEMLFLFALMSMVAISFGTISTSLCKNSKEITILNAVIVFPTCMLSGCLWPMELMNSFFQKLSLIFPQRHILILMDFLQGDFNFKAIFLETALILLICSLCITLSFIRINSKGWKTNL